MDMSFAYVIAYMLAIVMLFIFGRLFLVPIKIVLKLVYNALIGGAAILVINFIGGFFTFHIDLNVLSALIVGFLGVPGVALLIVLKYLFLG